MGPSEAPGSNIRSQLTLALANGQEIGPRAATSGDSASEGIERLVAHPLIKLGAVTPALVDPPLTEPRAKNQPGSSEPG